ncbi:hypothetical protein C8R43DRAFT_942400 [Mycena crocata]|nr:hypothetical protein C8R43DRAFT_942400 [Mycena crocata]
MSKRYVLYPIRQPEQWSLYKASQATFWTAEDHQLPAASCDLQEPTIMTIQTWLADTIASYETDTLEQISMKTTDPEIHAFLGYHTMILTTFIRRNIHTESCVNMLQYITLSTDQVEQALLQAQIRDIHRTWRKETLRSNADTPATRTLTFICTENIFLSKLFMLASADLIKLPNEMQSALKKIAMDRELTLEFLARLYAQIGGPDAMPIAEAIVGSALKTEIAIITANDLMTKQVETILVETAQQKKNSILQLIRARCNHVPPSGNPSSNPKPPATWSVATRTVLINPKGNKRRRQHKRAQEQCKEYK